MRLGGTLVTPHALVLSLQHAHSFPSSHCPGMLQIPAFAIVTFWQSPPFRRLLISILQRVATAFY